MPTVVGVGAQAFSTGNITPAYPAGYTAVADDVAVTFIETNSETITPPTNWVVAASIPVASGTTTRLTAIWRRLTASEAAPTITSAANHKIGTMIVVTGCRTSGNPYEAAPASTELVADTSVSIPGATTTNNNVLCLYAFSTGQDANSTAGATGWADASLANVAEQMDGWRNVGTGGGLAMASGEKATAGATGAMTATLSLVSNFKALMMVALVGVAGGATNGTAEGVYSFAGSASGVPETTGTAAGAFTFTGTAAGVPEIAGTAEAALTFTGTAVGVRAVTSTGEGLFTFTGAASGTSGAPAVEGQATGTFTFDATAAGVRDVLGAAVATFTSTTTGSGLVDHPATADGAFTFTGTGAGVPGVLGQTTAALTFTGTAAGAVEGQTNGTAEGTYTLTATAVGTVGRLGIASVTLTFGATASGVVSAEVNGTAEAALTFAGSASGVVSLVVTGTAEGAYTFTGAASGGESSGSDRPTGSSTPAGIYASTTIGGVL
jgi:hypothetical protein